MMYKRYFKRFMKEVDRKLRAGYETYGDGSFEKSPEDLMKELQLECIDLAGWGLILWARIEILKKQYVKKRN